MMDDDFNTAAAIAILFDTVREGNRRIDMGKDPGPWAAASTRSLLCWALEPPTSDLSGLDEQITELLESLGIASAPTADENIALLLSERDRARTESDWTRADAVRNGLAALGIIVEDTPDGARWHRG